MSNLTLKHNPTSFEAAVKALDGRKSLTIGHNTKLVQEGENIYATYHDNQIVEYSKDGVMATWAGWTTPTTSNRLNKLTNGRFNIKQREPHVNGEKVSPYDWVSVN